jgi:hypothetical protein
VVPAGLSKAEPKTVTVKISFDGTYPIVNGEIFKPEFLPFIFKNRIMVSPMLMSHGLNIPMDYNVQDRVLTIKKSNITLTMNYNSLFAIVNGKEAPIDTSFIIRGNRLVVPLRFITETFGATVSWDPILHKASIVYEIPEEGFDIVCTTKINETTYKILEIEHSSKTVNMYLFDETYKPILDGYNNQITFLPGEFDFDKKLANCINSLFVNKIEIKSESSFFFQIHSGHMGDWEMALGLDYTGPSAIDYKKNEIHELDETFSKNAIVGEFTVTTQENDSYTGFRYSPNLYKKWYQTSIKGKVELKTNTLLQPAYATENISSISLENGQGS